MEQLNVFASPLPFSNQRIKTVAPVGMNLAEIVESVMPDTVRELVDAVVLLDGEVIPKAQWSKIIPSLESHLNIRVIPAGGGGKKNPLATILSIAVLIAAPYAAGALATNVGLGIFGGGVLTAGQLALTKGVLTAAFSIVGRLAVSAIAPPPKQSNAGIFGNAAAESPTQFIEGARNSYNHFGVVPVCLGTNRIFPYQAARAYTETQDANQYVRQLFTWGYGQKLSITSLKIGETDLDQFTDFEMAHRLEGDLHEGTDLFSNNVYQEDLNVLLTSAAGYSTRTLRSQTDEALIDVTFPQGLFSIDDMGNRYNRSVSVEVEYSVSGSGIWTNIGVTTYNGQQSEALRRSIRITFPARDNYDIRIRRNTPDNLSQSTYDEVYLTALRSIRYESPVRMVGINGTAMRIKATDQLNGGLDQFNGVVTNEIPDYDASSGTWISRGTSNPASIYRYVLQGFPNARPLPDEKINIEALEDWHAYCLERGYTYDRMIDFVASVDDILRDVASAGAASPDIVDGIRTIVIDRAKEDIVQMVTPRNSWGYSGEMLYPQLPHAFRVTFRNSAKGYQQDERIVYNDGYDESNATLFEEIEIQSCTNAALAFKFARRMLATARLRPETHTFSMDVENLVALRGDRIKFEHDVPLFGVGDGRIKTVYTTEVENVIDGDLNVIDGDENVIDYGVPPFVIIGFELDDTISIPQMGTYYARIRLSDGTQIYEQIVVEGAGEYTMFRFLNAIEDGIQEDDLVYVVAAGGEQDLIITRIEPGNDLTAKITAVDYAPGIFSSDTGPIPIFNSNITVPLEFVRPLAPILLRAQGDESVLLQNADGTFTNRAVFTLENPNEGTVTPDIKIRVTGTTQFANANVLEANAERVAIAGLQTGTRYDIYIRYRRTGSNMFSPPLQINNFLYQGESGLPSDVTGFKISVSDNTAIFSWNNAPDIDFSHWRMKFSSLYSGASWTTAQLLEDRIYQNRITLPFQGGTYLIKAVDRSGNESADAAVIITYEPTLVANAVEIINEQPSFAGAKVNVVLSGSEITLDDPNIPNGTYYFANDVDLGSVFTSFVSASIVAGGTAIVDDSAFQNNLFDIPNIFNMEDVFGIGLGGWDILLEYRVTNDDPDNSGAIWSDWAEFSAGNYSFRAIEFRIQLFSLEFGVSPAISTLSVTVDMPDRIERGEDLICPAGVPAVVTFDPPFKKSPAVVITIQDGDEDDRIEFTVKEASGFAFRVYNAASASYVERVYDFIASGYGRESV